MEIRLKFKKSYYYKVIFCKMDKLYDEWEICLSPSYLPEFLNSYGENEINKKVPISSYK